MENELRSTWAYFIDFSVEIAPESGHIWSISAIPIIQRAGTQVLHDRGLVQLAKTRKVAHTIDKEWLHRVVGINGNWAKNWKIEERNRFWYSKACFLPTQTGQSWENNTFV